MVALLTIAAAYGTGLLVHYRRHDVAGGDTRSCREAAPAYFSRCERAAQKNRPTPAAGAGRWTIRLGWVDRPINWPATSAPTRASFAGSCTTAGRLSASVCNKNQKWSAADPREGVASYFCRWRIGCAAVGRIRHTGCRRGTAAGQYRSGPGRCCRWRAKRAVWSPRRLRSRHYHGAN